MINSAQSLKIAVVAVGGEEKKMKNCTLHLKTHRENPFNF
jgi:hypothetical protein